MITIQVTVQCAPSLTKNPLEFFNILRFLSPPASKLGNLSYAKSDFVFTINLPISEQTPNFVGKISDCTISPSLPTGLTLESVTCKISGTPTKIQNSTNYIVTATNSFSSTSATISITINSNGPSNFSYSNSSPSFVVNQALAAILPNVDGTITSCSSSPTFPTGLTLASDCSYSGTPTTLQGAVSYTITATNTFGSASTTLTISIIIPAPSSFSYAGDPFTFTMNSGITSVNPTVTGAVASYSVSPALPTGLSIHATTGVLSGTPTSITATASYTVTATNSTGNTTVSISITVNDVAPSSLSYTGSPFTFTKNATIANLLPTVTGTPTSYSISPSLPTGLSFNTTTGEISGTPTAITSLATYTITATNSGGNTNCTIDFEIITNTPTGLAGANGGVATTQITWNAVTGATSYNLYFSTASGVTIGGGGVTQLTGVSSPYSHTGLTDYVAYYYIVTSNNGLGESAASAEISATPGLPSQCTSYTAINGDDRTTSSTGSTLCDGVVMGNFWVRFTGANTRLYSSGIPPFSTCLTDATGWMTTSHPSTIGVITAATVCYHWTSSSCDFNNGINVTNCAGYYVYQLPMPPLCSLRYCTEP